MIYDLFTTREKATIIWFGAFIMVSFINKKVRHSAIKLLKSMMHKIFIKIFMCLVGYVVVITLLFSKLIIWNNHYIKDIVIWTLFACLPALFASISQKVEDRYIRQLVIDNFKFMIFVELFINFYTFNIIVELITFPFLIFIYLMLYRSNNNEEYKSVNIFLTSILSIFGIIVLFISILNLFDDFSAFWNSDTLVSVLIPIVYTLIMIPFYWTFMIYIKYDSIFFRLKVYDCDNKKKYRRHKRKIINACGISMKKIEHFQINGITRLSKLSTEETFQEVIRKTKDYK